MRKIMLLAALILLTVTGIWADTQSDFSKNISAYNSQIAAKQYAAAATSVSKASEACVAVKNYEGAFNVLSNMDRVLASRNIRPDSLPEVFYTLAKAKFNIYQTLKNSSSAQAQLQKMISYAQKSGSKKLINSMLFNSAQYYYSINQPTKGDQCISKLIRQFDDAKDYKAADAAYQRIIKRAVSANNAEMVEHTYENYMKWSDSIDAINADTALGKVQKEYAASQETIAQKDKTIKGKTGLIATFIVLFIIALALLGIGTWFYFRIVAKNRRLHKSVEAANEQSAAKSAILHNMSLTMEPTLDKLDNDNPAVQNLRGYMKRVGELSDVGNTVPKAPEELEDVDIEKYCNEIADEIRPQLRKGVKLHLDINKGMARIDAAEVRKILNHLLENAAKYTPEDGKICLYYKKRGAKVHQFIVSDSGPGIPRERHETIFTAFSNGNIDLAEGDGLGLPICALRAEKLGGKLELDQDHSKGATFVLTVRA